MLPHKSDEVTYTAQQVVERIRRQLRQKSKTRVREVHELRPDLWDPVARALLWNLATLAARPVLWLLDSRVGREHRRRLHH